MSEGSTSGSPGEGEPPVENLPIREVDPDLEEGAAIKVCTRTTAPAGPERGGPFSCTSEVTVKSTQIGPNVSLADMWDGVLAGDVESEEVEEAWLYRLKEGKPFSEQLFSSFSLYDGENAPGSEEYAQGAIVRTDDDVLRIFVGVAPKRSR